MRLCHEHVLHSDVFGVDVAGVLAATSPSPAFVLVYRGNFVQMAAVHRLLVEFRCPI